MHHNAGHSSRDSLIARPYCMYSREKTIRENTVSRKFFVKMKLHEKTMSASSKVDVYHIVSL